jgi:hypothetical protein
LQHVGSGAFDVELLANKYTDGDLIYMRSLMNNHEILLQGNDKLTSVTVNNQTRIIAGGAMANQQNLETFVIPVSVAYIGSRVFENTNIETITYEGTV